MEPGALHEWLPIFTPRPAGAITLAQRMRTTWPKNLVNSPGILQLPMAKPGLTSSSSDFRLLARPAMQEDHCSARHCPMDAVLQGHHSPERTFSAYEATDSSLTPNLALKFDVHSSWLSTSLEMFHTGTIANNHSVLGLENCNFFIFRVLPSQTQIILHRCQKFMIRSHMKKNLESYMESFIKEDKILKEYLVTTLRSSHLLDLNFFKKKMFLFKFLTWTISKVCIKFVTIFLLFNVLVFWPRGMCDLSFPAGDQTCTSLH